MKTALSGIYFIVWWLWDFLYEQKVIIPKKVNAFVVSVGNLTVGGTGKTPLTLFLARFYQDKGYRVGIVSRGYKGNYQGKAALVSDGKTVLTSADVSGDEPALMAKRLVAMSIPVAVSKARYDGCQLLIEKFNVNLILLDDGFQHRRLHRDLNLLLVDTTQQNDSVLPKGPMREGLSAAKRADVIIFTRQEKMLDSTKGPAPSLHTAFAPVELVHLRTGVSYSLSDLSGEKVCAFCGIGNPDSFVKILTDLGAKICETIFFRDHFHYTASVIKEIGGKSLASGAKWIVTTEKDAVKIASLPITDLDIFALRIDLVFYESSSVWERMLLPDQWKGHVA